MLCDAQSRHQVIGKHQVLMIGRLKSRRKCGLGSRSEVKGTKTVTDSWRVRDTLFGKLPPLKVWLVPSSLNSLKHQTVNT